MLTVDRFTLYIGGWWQWKGENATPCKKGAAIVPEGNMSGRICQGEYVRIPKQHQQQTLLTAHIRRQPS